MRKSFEERKGKELIEDQIATGDLTVRVYTTKKFSQLRELIKVFALLNPKVVLKDKSEQ